MITYAILLILTFLFASLFVVGGRFLLTLNRHMEWDEEQKNNVKKKSSGMLVFSLILLIGTLWLGVHFKGNEFIYWFAGAFIVRLILEIIWSRK